MATAAHIGQAIGMAAYVAMENKLEPKDLLAKNFITILQTELLKSGQHIPRFELNESSDLVQAAEISVSSEYELAELTSAFSKPLLDPDAHRVPLRQAGLLTRDPRMKERKKYGLKRARKAPQYTKR